MSQAGKLTRRTPLSKLSPKTLTDLCGILNMDDNWRKVAAIVRFRRTGELKYTQDFEFCQLQRADDSAKCVIRSLYPDNRSIGYLIDLLQEIELYREAKVLCEVIGEPPVTAPPLIMCTEDLPIPSMELTEEIHQRAANEGYLPPNRPYNPMNSPGMRGLGAEYSYETIGVANLAFHEQAASPNFQMAGARQNGSWQAVPGGGAQEYSDTVGEQNYAYLRSLGAVTRSTPNANQMPVPVQQERLTLPDILIKQGEPADVSYQQLKVLSKGFSESVGIGGFGEVFYGKTQSGIELAIKRLAKDKDITRDRFRNEVDLQAKCIHKNIAPVYAVCDDGVNMCIIYPYMKHGTLRKNLASSSPMKPGKRFTVAKGTAAAIHYLHTTESKPMLHLDVTSANILLDGNFEPKLSDFGQVRYGPALDDPQKTTTFCQNKIGTQGYMPWEFISRGQTSVKTDIHCFGVVLMEILTGMKHYDNSREDEEKILCVFLENRCSKVTDVLDTRAGQWNMNDARSMFDVANACLNHKREDRPHITQIWETIQNWKEAEVEILV